MTISRDSDSKRKNFFENTYVGVDTLQNLKNAILDQGFRDFQLLLLKKKSFLSCGQDFKTQRSLEDGNFERVVSIPCNITIVNDLKML